MFSIRNLHCRRTLATFVIRFDLNRTFHIINTSYFTRAKDSLVDVYSFTYHGDQPRILGALEPVKIVLPILSNDRKWRKAAFFLLNRLLQPYTVTHRHSRALSLFEPSRRVCSRKRKINAVVEESSLPREKETRGKVDFHSRVSLEIVNRSFRLYGLSYQLLSLKERKKMDY